MDAIIQKTRELGQLLLDSEECKRMKQAEAEAMGNAEAALLIEKYLQLKAQVQDLLIEENPDTEKLRMLSEEMEGCQDRMGKLDVIVKMTEAQVGFSNKIEQVNATLRFIITGETGEESSDGCQGNCAHCHGCH